ncbi:MAG: hypothetical protein RIQ72_588 [Candidatus Parcubacteria bacterium]|jgi:hypothetical protein
MNFPRTDTSWIKDLLQIDPGDQGALDAHEASKPAVVAWFKAVGANQVAVLEPTKNASASSTWEVSIKDLTTDQEVSGPPASTIQHVCQMMRNRHWWPSVFNDTEAFRQATTEYLG